MLLSTDMLALKPCWSGERIESILGVILSRMQVEMILLSVLLTTSGLVSSTKFVGFFWENVEQTTVEVWRGGVTGHEAVNTSK